MKIVGHNANGCAFFHQLFTVRDILPGCLRLILCQNPRSINAFFLQIPCHSLCFRPRLIASLSSGNNADRVRVFIQIFHSLIQTIFKNRTRTVLSHLCAKYDNIVEPPSSIRVHLADHTALYDTKHKQSDTDNHSRKDFYRMRNLFPHFHVHGNSKQKHHDPDTNPYKEKSCAGTGRMNHYRINHAQDSKQ